MRLVVALVALVLVACSGPATARQWIPGQLTAASEGYLTALLRQGPVQTSLPAQVEAATQAEQSGNHARAVAALEEAIRLQVTDASLWRRLSVAQARLAAQLPATPADARTQTFQRAAQARWMAARLGSDPAAQADDMVATAAMLRDTLARPDLAVEALREALARVPTLAGARAQFAELTRTLALQVLAVTGAAQGSAGEICLTADQPLGDRPDLRWGDFVDIQPASDAAFVMGSGGRQLCAIGLPAGRSYRVTIRAGLPAADVQPLARAVTRDIRLPDLPTRVSFPGNGWILPRLAADRLPISTINVSELEVWIYRVPQANLQSPKVMMPFDAWDLDWNAVPEDSSAEPSAPDSRWVAVDDGELVWTGSMEITAPRNRATVTNLPIGQTIGALKPGIYAVVAHPKGEARPVDRFARSATQWLVVTDLAASLVEGADGTLVQVRSIATAKPVAGVTVSLIARNREQRETVTTDADGLARLPAERRRGGQRGDILLLRASDGDTSFMRMGTDALDLSERGISGRRNPGPLDAFVYTDRGIYRPGETVNVTALVRDEAVRARPGLPVTLRLKRPVGTVFHEAVVPDGGLGGYVTALSLPANAARGVWRIEVLVDRTAAPIGTASIEVQDFVPEQIAVEVSSAAQRLVPGQPVAVTADARFLYGAPGSGLGVRAALIVEADPEPFERWRGWRFGLDGTQFPAERVELTAPETNAQGRTSFQADVRQLPDVSVPLRGVVEVDVLDPGGRAVRARLPLAIAHQPVQIGVKPQFRYGSVDANSTAAVDVVAVDLAGAPVTRPLVVEWFEERIDWLWFNSGRSWRDQVRSIRVASSIVSVSPDQPLTVRQPVRWGRYRVEVRDQLSTAATSLRFHAGWRWNPGEAPTPDVVELSSDRTDYRAGEVAKVRLSPPFAGEALVTVATDRVLSTQTITVPQSGAEVEIPVSADWGPGAYVTATLVRPRDLTPGPQPTRGVGVVWLARSVAERQLEVTLTLPERVEPQRRVEIPVQVAGASGPTFLTLAAVDEGILRLTSFQSPNPLAHFLARRQLGVTFRDQYANLITLAEGDQGRLRSGGDFGAGLDVVPFKVLSLFQGPIALDAQGRGTVSLDLPDFVGAMRVMAVAWDEARLGSAAGMVTVRKAVVADLNFPRFLAPNDRAEIALNLHNVSGSPGDHSIRLTVEGPVRLSTVNAVGATLAAGERRTIPFEVTATGPGIARIALQLDGPDGLQIARDWQLQVRSAQVPEARFSTRTLAAGERVAVGQELLQPFLPGTGRLSLSLSTRVRYDVAGLRAALEAWAYGCLEQTVARGLPLVAAAAPTPEQREQAALSVQRVMELQRFDGWFGLWSAGGDRQLWLTAFAVDFLARAKAAGVPVVDGAYEAAVRALADYVLTEVPREGAQLPVRVAALAALTRAGAVRLPMLRYIADGFGARIEGQFANAQLGWALWKLGDEERARAAFLRALAAPPPPPADWWWRTDDYSTPLRELAGTIALLGETGLMPERMGELADRLPLTGIAARTTSTQEQTWLILAAEALGQQAPSALQIDGAPLPSPLPSALPLAPERVQQGVSVANVGATGAWIGISSVGIPAVGQSAQANGMRIRRFFFTLTGQPANLDTLRQGDRLVVVLEAASTVNTDHQALIVHPLPAGWEIENARLSGDRVEPFSFLREVSFPDSQEARDDRYAAAITVPKTGQVRLAFVVRVVTPGTFELPGAVVMDQYRPRWFARQADGRITQRGR
ncbi:MAG: alpha-2-macroglobulin [Alphaproteobacteria bacterium]|nr:alpha-2-macroglobulin [Alphaproteobacteria bacterium]